MKNLPELIEALRDLAKHETFRTTAMRQLVMEAADHLEAAQAGAFARDDAPLSQGALDVLAERQRQKDKEGWTAEHDDKWKRGELRHAATCYAVGGVAYMWPWDMKWWKPGSIRRNLVKAAALLIAEIDRIDRDAARQIAPLEGDTDGTA